MAQNSQRLPHIVLLQAFGVILVLLGHALEPFSVADLWYDISYPQNTYMSILYEWIYSFHMPLFFFISGYLLAYKKYYNKSWVQFIKNRSMRLLIPFFVYTMAIWLPFYTLYLKKPIFSMDNFLFDHCGHLWFLLTLFLTLILYNLLLKTSIRKSTVVLTVVVLYIQYFHPDLSLPSITYERVLLHLIFVHLGYIYALYLGRGNNTQNNRKIFYKLLILLVGLCLVTVLAHIFAQQLKTVLYPILMVTLCYTIAFGVTYMKPLLTNNKVAAYISQNMMTIYLWHYIPCLVCHHVFVKRPNIPPFINVFILLLVVSMSVIVIVELYNKSKTYLMLFKDRNKRL